MTNDSNVRVKVKHLGELEEVRFPISLTATLTELWDKAYDLLPFSRDARDKLQCNKGDGAVDLTPYLGSTLAQLFEDGLCQNKKFEIAAETGGA